MKKKVIVIENLTSGYSSGSSQTLKGINLSIEENEFVGIIGQNGAGKSTLLKHIMGILKPVSGKVTILDSDTKNIKVSQLSAKVGFVLQNPDLQLFAQSIRREIEFGLQSAGLSRKEMEYRLDHVLAITGLKGREEEFPLALSRGERTKVVIAAVLAMNPEIIILDEPTRGQDYNGRRQIMAIVKDLHHRGKTIIMVSHDMPLVAEYAKRIIVLKKGELLMDGRPSEVFSRPGLLIKSHIKPPHITSLGFALHKELGYTAPVFREEQMRDLVVKALTSKKA